MIRLARITIYPLKSLDGVDLPNCGVLPSGALAGDRRWRLVDSQGNVVSVRNARELAKVRCQYDDSLSRVTLSAPGREPMACRLDARDRALGQWFSDYLARPIRIEENNETGFPDDPDAAGPTLLSQGTLQQLGEWFSGIDVDEAHRRLRANLVVDAQDSFWEDRLVEAECPVRFRIGQVVMQGEKVCQRCVIPSLDSNTGEPIEGFAKRASRMREEQLPGWSPRSHFDHFYRIAINTNLASPAESMLPIAVGDEVSSLVD